MRLRVPFERYHAFVENGANVCTTHHGLLHPYTTYAVPQAQALRPEISMYESATEHTKSLVLTASVQRSQRAAELNRRSCVGVDHRGVPYQTVGWSKRHASLPIGWAERIYALDPRVYLANSKITQSPIGSHPCKKLHSLRYGHSSGNEKICRAACSARHLHSHPCRSRITCVVPLSRNGLQRRHVMIRSNRYVMWLVLRTHKKKASRSVGVGSGLPCSCFACLPRGLLYSALFCSTNRFNRQASCTARWLDSSKRRNEDLEEPSPTLCRDTLLEYVQSATKLHLVAKLSLHLMVCPFFLYET